MLIGVDLDNTIVDYDQLFSTLAVEQQVVPASIASNKLAIRDYLRANGQEPLWTAMQGSAYGPRMHQAVPYTGVVGFFEQCRSLGIPTVVISHRSRRPYAGEPHDLHAAALEWITTVFGKDAPSIYLEETKAGKLARIGAVGCTHFIDDLPELLGDPAFPAGVLRYLFDPHGHEGTTQDPKGMPSWQQICRELCGDGKAAFS